MVSSMYKFPHSRQASFQTPEMANVPNALAESLMSVLKGEDSSIIVVALQIIKCVH